MLALGAAANTDEASLAHVPLTSCFKVRSHSRPVWTHPSLLNNPLATLLCPLFVLCAHEVYVQENEMGLVLQTSRDRSVSNFFSRPLSLVRFL